MTVGARRFSREQAARRHNVAEPPFLFGARTTQTPVLDQIWDRDWVRNRRPDVHPGLCPWPQSAQRCHLPGALPRCRRGLCDGSYCLAPALFATVSLCRLGNAGLVATKHGHCFEGLSSSMVANLIPPHAILKAHFILTVVCAALCPLQRCLSPLTRGPPYKTFPVSTYLLPNPYSPIFPAVRSPLHCHVR